MGIPNWSWIGAVLAVAGCAHDPAATGADHRAAAAADVAAAERAKAKYDPEAVAMAISPRSASSPDEPVAPPRFYNPSAAHLVEADRKMSSAFKHLEAARRLEKYEDAACAGLSDAERMACPLIAPHLEQVEEGRRGIVLHLKSAERTRTLAAQMRCHLAFAMANDFERAPCPLYLKGVAIARTGEKAIEVASGDPAVARQVREEARKMFGQPPNAVSSR